MITVKEVLFKGHDWLNFFMTIEEKIEIFNCGEEAAKQFLINFDWENYKIKTGKNKIIHQMILTL
jgi:hypothetical protein